MFVSNTHVQMYKNVSVYLSKCLTLIFVYKTKISQLNCDCDDNDNPFSVARKK